MTSAGLDKLAADIEAYNENWPSGFRRTLFCIGVAASGSGRD